MKLIDRLKVGPVEVVKGECMCGATAYAAAVHARDVKTCRSPKARKTARGAAKLAAKA